MAGFGVGDEQDRENHYRRATMLHPSRQRIARRLSDGEEASTAALAAQLEEPAGRVAYHVRVLVRRGVLKVVPRRRPKPPLYRWSADAQWAREMLAKEDE